MNIPDKNCIDKYKWLLPPFQYNPQTYQYGVGVLQKKGGVGKGRDILGKRVQVVLGTISSCDGATPSIGVGNQPHHHHENHQQACTGLL